MFYVGLHVFCVVYSYFLCSFNVFKNLKKSNDVRNFVRHKALKKYWVVHKEANCPYKIAAEFFRDWFYFIVRKHDFSTYVNSKFYVPKPTKKALFTNSQVSWGQASCKSLNEMVNASFLTQNSSISIPLFIYIYIKVLQLN